MLNTKIKIVFFVFRNFCFVSEHSVVFTKQDMKFWRFLLWRWFSPLMRRRVVW